MSKSEPDFLTIPEGTTITLPDSLGKKPFILITSIEFNCSVGILKPIIFNNLGSNLVISTSPK